MLAAVPAMPVKHAPETAFAIYTGLMCLVTLGFLAWWRFTPERRQGPALPLIVLGGGISGLMEAWLDNVVLYRWPPEQHLAAFQAFGRTVPLFVPIGYAWFCGALLYVVARRFERGVSARQVWALLGIIAFVDFAAIGLSAWIGVSDFFGDPPLSVAGYPIWWAAIDGCDVLIGATLVWFLRPRLQGREQLWLVVVPVIALGASAGAVGWPVSTALNSQWSAQGKLLCALATIGLGLCITHFIARLMSAAQPAAAPSGARRTIAQPPRSAEASAPLARNT